MDLGAHVSKLSPLEELVEALELSGKGEVGPLEEWVLRRGHEACDTRVEKGRPRREGGRGVF